MDVKLMDKYILKEVSYPFLLGVFIITIILVGSYFFHLADLIIVKNVPFSLVFRLLLYRLPGVMVETFPIAVLFATMTAINRLNRENEITALRMGGVSIFRLVLPLFILGLLISSFTFLLNENIVPWTNHQAQNIIRQTILKDAMPDPESEVFFQGPRGRLFYVSSYNQSSGELKNIVIYQLASEAEFPEVITAVDGLVEDNAWLLNTGIIHQYNQGGEIILESKFNQMEIELTDQMREVMGTQKSTAEMSRGELGRRIELFRRSGIGVNSLLVDYHLKLAEPLAALLFILISLPLSLSSKESSTWNFILTIIIVFLYYVVLSFSRSFGRNEVLSPLLAAWLPNLIFLFLALILMLWRDFWQRILNKSLAVFGITAVVAFLILLPGSVRAEELFLSGESLSYDQANNLLEISTNISGRYGKYHIRSDRIEIQLKDGERQLLDQIAKAELEPGIISGCDFDQPHYFFDAKRVIIKPGDYIKLYGVSFKELNGRLPLFYWPYLYIPLDREQQNFFPAVGYHQRRGWFVKTKYFYNTRFNLPGNLYLDRYSISGYGGGIKQYVIYEADQQAYLYYYTQENRTDLSGLFNWEAEYNHLYQSDNWDAEFNYLYQDYDEKTEIEAELDLRRRKDRSYSRIELDYDKIDYFEADFRDSEEYGLDFYQRDVILGGLNYIIDYQLDFDKDPELGLSREENRRLDLGYRFESGWNLGLEYYDGEKESPEQPFLSRWGGEVSAEKLFGDFRLDILVERYAPSFAEEDEDEVRFSRLPEIELSYNPRGSFDYLLAYGNYYEDISDTEAQRFKAQGRYRNTLNVFSNTYFRQNHLLAANTYLVEGFDGYKNQIYSENNLRLVNNLTDKLRLTNVYQYDQLWYESPFRFDSKEEKDLLQSSLRYSLRDNYDFRFSSGYDFLTELYSPLEARLEYYPVKNWQLNLATSYDLNEKLYDDNLILRSIYQSKRFEHKLGMRYDLNNSELKRLDNRLVFEISGDYGWYIEANLSLDYDYEEWIREGNIQLKKNFHCRELAFSYDYVREEFTLQYSINLFPSQPIGITKSDDDMIFDLGIEELL
ncbi:YjgP/YjgQ family permease [Halanaerobium hydrogeniformans]|uniref:Permease YjgP/YjgQ family protein n=1 Tax=Halanaerobium hydrogeniformans TaxID=656519 RepID=E4RPQ2_HALHG|nr:YjgP/YjgQ family permease [Halanaerobium hydrogeniformans]ADQ13936.1 permease YjgP/YjgQ family protein [Halanaerobium hydrogeniformans]